MTAWVLNLDADFELAHGTSYAPKKSVQDAMNHHARSLVGTLTRPGDVIVDDRTLPNSAKGLRGRAFCPTPRAITMLVDAGADPEPHASFEILRRVNSRAFCQSLGVTMPHASFETDLARAEAKLRSDPVIARGWRVKRSWGVAGRGQRVLDPGDAASFLVSWIEEGGVQIEPNVEVVTEIALHAMLEPSGDFSIGEVVVQTCDAAGAWIASTRAPNHVHRDAMREEVTRVARALHAAGYWGPFGVDAFHYRASGGALHFQPRSEINARYSMAFAIGFATTT